MVNTFYIQFRFPSGRVSERIVTIKSELDAMELLSLDDDLIAYVTRKTRCKQKITIVSVTSYNPAKPGRSGIDKLARSFRIKE